MNTNSLTGISLAKPLILLPTLFPIILGACAEKKEPVVFEPTANPVRWQTLAPKAVQVPRDAFHIAIEGKTTGIFPASVAVARVKAPTDAMIDGAALMLDMKPEVEFLAWNSLFDDLRSISEVFPLNQRGMDGEQPTHDTILETAADLNAQICIIYAENLISVYDAEIRGVLLTVSPPQLLATVHAGAHVDNPIALEDLDEFDELPPDHEQRDPRMVATRRFEMLIRGCILNLIANDEPADLVAPEGWVPDRELRPISWPPYEDRRNTPPDNPYGR